MAMNWVRAAGATATDARTIAAPARMLERRIEAAIVRNVGCVGGGERRKVARCCVRCSTAVRRPRPNFRFQINWGPHLLGMFCGQLPRRGQSPRT